MLLETTPFISLVLAAIALGFHCFCWYRIFAKAELPIGWVIIGVLCAALSAVFGPTLVVTLAISAFVPWPYSRPISRKIKR